MTENRNGSDEMTTVLLRLSKRDAVAASGFAWRRKIARAEWFRRAVKTALELERKGRPA